MAGMTSRSRSERGAAKPPTHNQVTRELLEEVEELLGPRELRRQLPEKVQRKWWKRLTWIGKALERFDERRRS